MTHQDNRTLGSFSQRLNKNLDELGWMQPSTQTVNHCVEAIETCGFAINNAARSAIEKFGGCEFDFPDESGVSWLRFDLSEPRHTFEASHVDNLTELLGETPCPIGGGAGYIILVAPSGQAVVLQEQWFFMLSASSLPHLLEAIVFNNREGCQEFPDIELHKPT